MPRKLFALGCLFAMTVGARRSYLPVIPALLLVVNSAVGTLAILLVLRQAAHLDSASHALDYYRSADTLYSDTTTVRIADGLWMGLAGFVAATVASWRLWRIARRQQRESRTALAAIDAQLAVASGDIVEEREPIDIVPRL